MQQMSKKRISTDPLLVEDMTETVDRLNQSTEEELAHIYSSGSDEEKEEEDETEVSRRQSVVLRKSGVNISPPQN